MNKLFVAELKKVIYLRSTWVFLVSSAAFGALNTSATAFFLGSEENFGMPGVDTVQGVESVYANAVSSYLFALIIGILIMTSEYKHGTAVATFLVSPKRHRVLLAKIAVGATAGFTVQLISYLVGVFAGFITLSFQENVATPSTSSLLNTLFACLISGFVLGIVGVGLGALIKVQVAAITGAVLWTLLVESLIILFFNDIGKYLPGGVITGVLQIEVGGPPSLDLEFNFLSPGASTLLLLGYAILFSGIAALTTLKKDIE
jgi:hypothetical protein